MTTQILVLQAQVYVYALTTFSGSAPAFMLLAYGTRIVPKSKS